MEDLNKTVVKTGTTTLAIACKSGIVVAADKRMTAGHEVVGRNKVKILPLTDKIVVATAGVVSDIQRLVKVIKAEIRLQELRLGREVYVKEVSSLLTSLVYGNIRTPSIITPITGFTISGCDSTGNYIYNISPGGSVSDINDFTSDGSGGIYAGSILEDGFEEDLSVSDGIALAKRALNVSLLKDTASGNGYLIYSVTNSGTKLEADESINTGIKN